ncbi:MAG: hypothetical protein ACR2Q3_00720 [Woeseiaceae bacterium]
MTDFVWLLWNRALIDYAKAASTWLLIRSLRDETEVCSPLVRQPRSDDRKLLKAD